MKKTKRQPPNNIHYRDLPSVPYAECPVAEPFRECCRLQLLPSIAFTGRKLKDKAEIAIHVLNNLVLAGKRNAVVGDSRCTGERGLRMRIAVWDAIVEAGFARVCKGSELSGKTTRYRATRTSLEIFENWKKLRQLINLELTRNSQATKPTLYAPVVVHIEKKPQPLPEHPGIRKQLERLEDELERINRSNLEHSWQAFIENEATQRTYVIQPNVALRLIYSEYVGRGGRLYSWSALSGQNLTREQRQTILIDGEPCTELDFSGYHTRMLYHYRRIEPKGDVYRPQRILPVFHALSHVSSRSKRVVRDFVKTATNICWNVDSQAAANSAVAMLLADHPESKRLKRILFDIEGSNPVDFVERIRAAHPKLRRQFFTEVGLDLMEIDGRIMLRILGKFATEGKPALGIHDSVLCKRSDSEFALRTMRQAYRVQHPFNPVIKKAF